MCFEKRRSGEIEILKGNRQLQEKELEEEGRLLGLREEEEEEDRGVRVVFKVKKAMAVLLFSQRRSHT